MTSRWSQPGPHLENGPGRTDRIPTVKLFCGLPGAGKTTLAQRLEADGRGVRLCTDDWQAMLGVGHDDTEFHERLQTRLYGLALTLLGSGVDVILEDGLWFAIERAEKITDGRALGARIELHVFDVPLETLWNRLQRRNTVGGAAACPMTWDELDHAWRLFEPPSADELSRVDSHRTYAGGLDDD